MVENKSIAVPPTATVDSILALVVKPPRWMRLLALLISVSLVAALFYFGSRPFAGSLFSHPVDKLVHFSFYGGLAYLFWTMFGGSSRGADWTAVIFAVAVGVADEFVQMFNPHRSASLADLASDTLGIILVVYTLSVLRSRHS